MLLTAVTAAVWLAAGLPAGLFGWTGFDVSVTAATVCWLPAVGTLMLVSVCRRMSPVKQAAIVLATGFVRMVAAVGLGVAGYYLIPSLHESGLALLVWGLAFYLTTLATETCLLMRSEGR